MKAINNKLLEARQERGILIAAHRGTCGGNIVQNTIPAYENALQHGADIVEMDAIMSTDKDFFAFHNGQEKNVFGTAFDIRKLSTEDIKSLPLKNSFGENSGGSLAFVNDVLDHFKERCFFNIDRSWFYWKDIIAFIEAHPMRSQIVVKSAPHKELLEVLEKDGEHVFYMPIISKVEDWELMKQFEIRCIAAELVFDKQDADIVSKEFMDTLHKDNILLWVNAITLNDQIKLSAGLDDNNAIQNSKEDNWGKLIDMGFDIIQTDWPSLLKNFINTRK